MRIFYLTSKELNHETAVQIHSGDICIMNDSNALSVCFIGSELSQLRSKCNSIDVAYTKESSLDISVSNPVIFSYNGVDKRYGNIYVLQEIIKQIDCESVRGFFQDCVDIAKYKEDRFKSSFISEFFHHSMGKLEVYVHPKPYKEVKRDADATVVKEDDCSVTEEVSEKEKDVKVSKTHEIKAHPTAFYFYDFLNQTAQEEWIKLYHENMSARNIFYELRAKHKTIFGQALKAFNKEYPDLNVYSLNPCSVKKQPSPTSSCQTSEFDFLFEELANRGFTQISDEIWEDKDHKRYQISIQAI